MCNFRGDGGGSKISRKFGLNICIDRLVIFLFFWFLARLEFGLGHALYLDMGYDFQEIEYVQVTRRNITWVGLKHITQSLNGSKTSN